jgi:PAS domain S-box-containing protein
LFGLIDSLLDAIEEPALLARPTGAIVRANRAFERHAGGAVLPATWPSIVEIAERAQPELLLGRELLRVSRFEHEGEPMVLVRVLGRGSFVQETLDRLVEGVIVMRARRDDGGAVVDWSTELANDAIVALTGLTREALLAGTSFGRDPERTARVHAAWSSVLSTGKSVSYPAEVGGRHFVARVERIDEDRIAVIGNDVTMLAEAEQALRDTHERLSRLVALAPGVLFEFRTRADGTGGFTYVSPTARDLLEVEARELVDDERLFSRMLTPASVAHLASASIVQERTNALFQVDVEMSLPSGRTKWIRYVRRSEPTPDGGRYGAGVMVDITDERAARAAADAGSALLDTLLEHVPCGIIVSDLPDRRRHRMSRDAIDMLGFDPTPAELESLAITAEDGAPLPRSARPLARALAAGQPVRNMELTIEGRRGKRTVLASAAAAWVDGEPRTGVVTWHDVTERRAAEAAHQAERERLRVTLQSIGDAVISTDCNANVTLLNPVAERLTGWTLAEAVGKPLVEVFRIVNEDTRDPVESPVGRVLAEGIIVGLANHTLLIARDGSELPIADAAAPIREDNGAISGVVLVFRDQTVERDAERALRRSHAGLRSVIDRLAIGIFVTRDDAVVYANPAFCALLGIADEKALVGTSLDTFLTPEDEGASVRAPGASEAPPPMTRARAWRARRRDGRVVVIETTIARDVEFDGQPAVVWAARDLSEIRAIQAQLMQADRLASLGMLAAGIAHEINNPLAFTSASLDYIDEILTGLEPRLSEEERADLRDLLADAHLGAKRVRDVVRDLKAFSRTDDEAKQTIDLIKLLDSSVQLASTEIRHRSRLVRDYGPIPLVNAHEARLGQVFVNLLVNAAQAIPEGRAHDNEIRVATYTSPIGNAVIEISDTGTGIPAEVIDRIFDPFFTTKPVGVGTGIGLAICRSTIVALGGEIRAVNMPEQGAKFIVSLPPAEGRPSTPATIASAARPGTARRGRVLVIDDEPTIGAIVRRALHKEHEVTILEGARPAIELLDQGQSYDVILCDVMMPEMTGIEFYTHVAGAYPEHARRIVFLTGGAFTPKSAEFMEMVPNRRVEKPFDVAALRALISELVG